MESQHNNSMPVLLSLDKSLDQDEKILENLKKMLNDAPNEEMERIWLRKYNQFMRTLRGKTNVL